VFELALRGVRYNLGRYVATLLAIVTGCRVLRRVGVRRRPGDLGVRGRRRPPVRRRRRRAHRRRPRRLLHRRRGSTCASAVTPSTAIAALDETAAVAGELTGDVAFLAPDGDVFADAPPGDCGSTTTSSTTPTWSRLGTGGSRRDRRRPRPRRRARSRSGRRVTVLTLAGPFDATITASRGSATQTRRTVAAPSRSRG
jgi:hypothetical protein